MTKLARRILQKYPILRLAVRYFSWYTLKSSQVYFQRVDLSDLPPLKDVSPLQVKEMSTSDESQINEWLSIINQSFSRNWKEKDYTYNIINHEVYDVVHTYFLMDDEKHIGVVSEAVFRKNKQIGVTHYLGLKKEYWGRGLGKYLILYTLHKMKEHGCKSCEGESTLGHKKSLFIHFDLGFCPKTRLDYWNTPNRAPILMRAITNFKFNRVYREWKRNSDALATRWHWRQHNWLVCRIHDAALEEVLKRYACGILVDIGCGEKPYLVLTKGIVTQHIGVDCTETQHDRSNIDVLASAYDTTLPDVSADTVLCAAVLEHLERPEDAIREMYRILKPGGYMILTALLFWHLHEEPRDFYRYTKYGLEYLFTRAGFQIVEILPLSGFVITFSQELCYFLEQFRRRPIGRLISGTQFALQYLAYRLRRWDKSHGFTWMYLVVAQKRDVANPGEESKS